jgi:hypothetical protein
MKAIKSALLIGLAACVGATSGLARESGSHSKGSKSEKTSRSSSAKKKGSSSKSNKGKTSKSKKESRGSRLSETDRLLGDGFADLPAEDLPEPETDADSEAEPQ